VNFCVAVPLVIQKSKRSGSLLVSLAQYVGWHVDRCCKLLFLIVLGSSFRRRESGAPESIFGYEAVSKRLDETLVIIRFSVAFRGTVNSSDG